MDANIQNLANQLAEKALEKQALDVESLKQTLSGALSNPALRNGLLGAGAGGLVGLATGGEDKKRKALHYALLGGLGAGGLTAGAKLLAKATEKPPKELQAPVASTLGPIAKGVGVGAGAAAGAAGLAGLGLAGRHAAAGLGRSSPLARQLLRSFARMPGAARIGVPAAGAAMAYHLLSGNK